MSGGPAGGILFLCTGPAKWEPDERRWSGEIKITRRSVSMVEVIIYGRSSCMNVGCPLSRFSDIFWNKQRLSAHMQEADAVTTAYALKALSEYLGTDWL